MKKIFFMTALGIASILSAKSSVATKIMNSSLIKRSECKKSFRFKPQQGCFPFTLSCGVHGTACGENTAELIALIWDADNAICGN